jgi:hypothetical protein
MTLVQTTGSIIALALVNHHLSISWIRFSKTLAPAFLASTMMLLGITLIRPYLAQTPLAVLIEVVVGGAVYLGGLFIITGGAVYNDITDLLYSLVPGSKQR